MYMYNISKEFNRLELIIITEQYFFESMHFILRQKGIFKVGEDRIPFLNINFVK